jgi:hypothetical protein
VGDDPTSPSAVSGESLAWAWLRRAVLALAAAWLGHLALNEWRGLMRFQPPGIDFMPMWTAAREAHSRPGLVYDFAGLTDLERPLLGDFPGPRPFVYPPSTLLALTPFAAMSFGVAYAVWTAGGLLALFAALKGWASPERALTAAAAMLAPPSLLVAATGQITFYIAALAAAGLSMLDRRPWLAGACLGFAGAMKPQALLLLPFALAAAAAWRSLAAATLVGAAVAAASAVALGPRLWIDWANAVGAFERWVMGTPRLEVGMITPTALGHWIGLSGAALLAWRVGFGVLGVALAGGVFAVSRDVGRRLVALLGGALFVTPYAMHYDAALLAPAVALMLLGRPSAAGWLASASVGAVLCFAVKPIWGAAAVILFVIFASLLPGAETSQAPAPSEHSVNEALLDGDALGPARPDG